MYDLSNMAGAYLLVLTVPRSSAQVRYPPSIFEVAFGQQPFFTLTAAVSWSELYFIRILNSSQGRDQQGASLM